MTEQVDKKKMTIDEITERFLQETPRRYITEAFIESNCPVFGKDRFGVWHSAGSYSRRFRAIRDNVKGVKLQEVTQDDEGNSFKWKTWEIKPQGELF